MHLKINWQDKNLLKIRFNLLLHTVRVLLLVQFVPFWPMCHKIAILSKMHVPEPTPAPGIKIVILNSKKSSLFIKMCLDHISPLYID